MSTYDELLKKAKEKDSEIALTQAQIREAKIKKDKAEKEELESWAKGELPHILKKIEEHVENKGTEEFSYTNYRSGEKSRAIIKLLEKEGFKKVTLYHYFCCMSDDDPTCGIDYYGFSIKFK